MTPHQKSALAAQRPHNALPTPLAQAAENYPSLTTVLATAALIAIGALMSIMLSGPALAS